MEVDSKPLISELDYSCSTPAAGLPLKFAAVMQRHDQMTTIIFNEEWVVEARLTEKTGLTEGQIKSYRLNLWAEGVHFKRLTAKGETDNSNGLLWYNYPKINELVRDA